MGSIKVQIMDIRCSNWVIYIEIFIPIWIIESNGNNTPYFECEK